MAEADANDPEFSLTDTFNAFAEKAVADFPQLENRFVIYSAPTDTLHGSFPEEAAQHLLELQQDKVAEFFRKYDSRPAAVATSAEGYHFIDWIDKSMRRHNYRTGDDPYEREIRSYMEHELAHLIAPAAEPKNTKYNAVFKECVAEAFSFLRQQQQYGSIREQIDVACYIQSNLMALSGNTSHFCVPVLQELGRISEAYDLSAMNLTPAQTANMAYRLALLYAPSSPELRKLEDIFHPVKMISFHNPKTRWETPTFKACAEAMLADHGEFSSKTFAAGNAFLEPFLNKRMDILSTSGFIEEDFQKFSGNYWDSVREKIEVRTRQEEVVTLEQRLAQEARDMLAFGHFDKNPAEIIKPAPYESEKNMTYLQRAQNAYIAIRYLQETGKQMPDGKLDAISVQEADTLDQDRIIALACTMAEKSAPKPASAPPSLR